MFIENKYKRIYFSIIENSKNRDKNPETIEKHHVIPKCFGGSDDIDNIAVLTPRDHYICHLLLTKFTEGEYKRKMCYALSSFNRNNQHQKRNLTSRQYETIRRIVSDEMKGDNNPMRIHNIDMSGDKNPFYGKTHSDETRKIISEKIKEWLKQNENPFKGKRHSDKTKKILSDAQSKKIKVLFLNDTEIVFDKIIDLGPYLGKSKQLGLKLNMEKHKNLWKKYNIKEIVYYEN